MSGYLYMSRFSKLICYGLPAIFWICISICVFFLKNFEDNDYPPPLFLISLVAPIFIAYIGMKWGINLVGQSASIILMIFALWIYGIPLAIVEAPSHINSFSDFLLYGISFLFYSLWTPGLVLLTCWLLFFAKSHSIR